MKFIWDRKLLGYLLIAVCIVLVTRHILINKSQLQELSKFSLLHIFLWVLINLIHQIVVAFKAMYVCQHLGLKGISKRQWLKIHFTSFFLNHHITQGGKVYRSIVLKNEFQFPYTESIAMATFLVWYEGMFALSITAFSMWFSRINFIFHGVDIAVIFMLLLGGFFVSPFLGRFLLGRLNLRNEKLAWLHRKTTDAAKSIFHCMRSASFIIILTLFSLIAFALLSASTYIFFDGIGVHFNIGQLYFYSALTLCIFIFQITPNNFGIAELIYGFLGESVGVAFGNTLLMAGALRFLFYLVIAAVTIILNRGLAFLKFSKQLPIKNEFSG